MYFGLTHEVDPKLEGCQGTFARGWYDTRGGRRVACTGQGDGSLLRVKHHPLTMGGNAIGGMQIAKHAGIGRGRRNLGHGDQLEVSLEGVEVFRRASEAGGCVAAGGGKNAYCGIDGAQNHFLGATAAGDDTYAGFNQAHVKLGVRLAGGGVERDFRSPTEAEAKGRHHHWAGTKANGCGHALEGANGEVEVVPLPFLDEQQYLEQVGADGEVGAIAGDDKALEVADGVAGGVEHLGDEAGDIFPTASFLECSSMAAMPSPKSISDAPALLLTTPFDLRKSTRAAMPAGCSTGTKAAREGSKTVLPAGARPYQGWPCGVGAASAPTASHISKGPSSQLKPVRIARSMLAGSSAISGRQAAA